MFHPPNMSQRMTIKQVEHNVFSNLAQLWTCRWKSRMNVVFLLEGLLWGRLYFASLNTDQRPPEKMKYSLICLEEIRKVLTIPQMQYSLNLQVSVVKKISAEPARRSIMKYFAELYIYLPQVKMCFWVDGLCWVGGGGCISSWKIGAFKSKRFINHVSLYKR